MKRIFLFFIIYLPFLTALNGQEKLLYDFQVKSIEGEPFDLSIVKGKMVMIVNTATKCSLAPQFKRLQALYEEYGGDDFIILAFPSNDFFKREPGPNKEIKERVDKKYGITFPLMAKISVRGKKIHPLYKWLTSSSENGRLDAPVRWNFQKFLIDRDGRVNDFIAPTTRPDCRRVLEWLNSGLIQQKN